MRHFPPPRALRKAVARRPLRRGVAFTAAGGAAPARGLRREFLRLVAGACKPEFPMESQRGADDHYRLGRTALDAGDLQQAVVHLQAAYRLDAATPLYRSYYGLALGLAERRLERAISLCRSAATDEFFNPLHFHNLARVHLACGFKAEAIRYLRRGLMIDPGNPE